MRCLHGLRGGCPVCDRPPAFTGRSFWAGQEAIRRWSGERVIAPLRFDEISTGAWRVYDPVNAGYRPGYEDRERVARLRDLVEALGEDPEAQRREAGERLVGPGPGVGFLVKTGTPRKKEP